MKIMYIDTAIDGHHLAYLKTVVDSDNYDSILVLPEIVEDINRNQYTYPYIDFNKKNIFDYLKWIKSIKQIADKEKPDIIHFLTGDVFYKFFGIGLNAFKKYKTVMTIHWIRSGFLQQMSLKNICKNIDKVIVHSDYLKKEVNQLGILNAHHIEYPMFAQKVLIKKSDACKKLGIDENIPVISCIGNTRYDKGLDILLEALNQVENKFQLVVAGKPEAFDEKFIKENSKNYSDSVFLKLHYLDDDELNTIIASTDIIVLPYRARFNGASGPLVEGVYNDKCIIGSDHGNLGNTIEKNHLGFIFDSENANALSKCINKALEKKFEIDDCYINYQNSLNPQYFKKSYLMLYKNTISKK